MFITNINNYIVNIVNPSAAIKILFKSVNIVLSSTHYYSIFSEIGDIFNTAHSLAIFLSLVANSYETEYNFRLSFIRDHQLVK